MAQVTDHRLAHVHMFDLGKLEHQRRGDVRLLVRGLAEIELPRLAVVVGEALGTDAAFRARFSYRSAVKARPAIRVASLQTESWARTQRGPPVAPSACGRRVGRCRTGTWAR